MQPEAKRPDRALIVILSIIGLLVVVALFAVFSRGEPEPLDASTPAGVVQRYTAAVIDGDEAAAADYLTEDVRRDCDAVGRPSADNVRVTLVETTTRSRTADVTVSIVTSYEDGPFGASEYEAQEVFDLRKVDGTWLIESAPYQLAVCPNTAVK